MYVNVREDGILYAMTVSKYFFVLFSYFQVATLEQNWEEEKRDNAEHLVVLTKKERIITELTNQVGSFEICKRPVLMETKLARSFCRLHTLKVYLHF